MRINQISQKLFLGSLGGTIYYTIECIFRGFSHWSMFILGGICFLFFGLQGKETSWTEPLWKQVLRCTTFVVSCEFITGIIVNKWMGWEVWDYSDQPYHVWGQICLPFATLFSGLCVVGIWLCANILHWFYGEKKPNFHIV